LGGGGGVTGRRSGGGGGGVCCLGGGRCASSSLLSVCQCCGGGGGAPLCSSAPAVFWRLGAGSPTKEPSPRWSLRHLLPSAWLLRAGTGQHPHCPSVGALAPAPSPSLSRWGPDLWASAPRDPRWFIASGPVRRHGSGARGWGRPPVAGPPGRPRPASALTPGPMTAAPGPRTGPSPRSGGPGTLE
jgi:hypothetical protein